MTRADRTERERNWPRCPCCRTRRATATALQAHIRETGHKPCNCGGYHHAHRPYSPYCERNDLAGIRHAVREGHILPGTNVLEDLIIDAVWGGPGRPLKAWPC